MHIWYGRALFIIAMVNGGLGLRLSKVVGNRNKAAEIAYIVIAACVFVFYLCGASYGEWRRRRALKGKSDRDARAGE